MKRTVLMATMSALALASTPSMARGQGGTDVWVVPLLGEGAELSLGAPISVATRPGYDNQPSYSLDGSLLYYTVNVGGQTDIWRVATDDDGRPTGTPTAFTSTPESEYSAAEVPGRERIAVVRVEADSTQRLWSFDRDGGDPQVELADVAPVGYHAWASPTTVGMFVLGDPPHFVIADAPEGRRRAAAERIGRSIHRVPGALGLGMGASQLSFTTVLGGTQHVVSTFHPDGFDTRGLTALPEGVQDYAWLPDRSIVSGDGATGLLRWTESDGWSELGDVGLGVVTRIAVHPSGGAIAVVVEEPTTP